MAAPRRNAVLQRCGFCWSAAIVPSTAAGAQNDLYDASNALAGNVGQTRTTVAFLWTDAEAIGKNHANNAVYRVSSHFPCLPIPTVERPTPGMHGRETRDATHRVGEAQI